MDKLRFEPTVALVMQWALRFYTEDPVLQYVNQLNLSLIEKVKTKVLAVKVDNVEPVDFMCRHS